MPSSSNSDPQPHYFTKRKGKKVDFPALYYYWHLVMACRPAGLDMGSLRTRVSSQQILVVIKIDLLRPLNFSAKKDSK